MKFFASLCSGSSVTLAALATISFSTLAAAQTTTILPIRMTGPASSNPSGKLDYQDASFIRRASDGKYFRFTKSNDTGKGITVANSPNLRGPWTYSYQILNGTLKNPTVTNRSDTDVWAPEIHYVNSTYYLFYATFAEANSDPAYVFDMNVATSTNMDQGDWTDHGSMNMPRSPQTAYVRLGGNLLADMTDPQGQASGRQPYMVVGSHNWGLYGFPLADSLLTVADGAKATEVIADQINPPPYDTPNANKTEGGYQIINGQYIYLFYSAGNCCPVMNPAYGDSVYRIYVCRTALSDGPTGPYVDKSGKKCSPSQNGAGTLFLHSTSDGQNFAPGSLGILNDPAEGLVMTYQHFNTTSNDGLKFGFNYLKFDANNGGWPTLTSTR